MNEREGMGKNERDKLDGRKKRKKRMKGRE